MLLCINRELKVEKESNGTYHLSIQGNFNLYRVSIKKDDRYPYYMSYERGYLFVLDRVTGKMLLRGEIKSKEQLKDTVIVSSWNIYNPPHNKSFYY